MSTTTNIQVRKGLPYQVRVRADGKWDFTGNQTFTTAGQEYFATMETYDGLSMDYVESYQSADKVDFSNTVLPWKWQYSTALSTNRYCLMPAGQNYENVVEQFEGYVTDYTVVGSPTISSEYVVSGFSSSNYLQASGKRTYTAGEISSFINSGKFGIVHGVTATEVGIIIKKYANTNSFMNEIQSETRFKSGGAREYFI